MRTAFPFLALAAALAAPGATLAAPSPQAGKPVFEKWCAPCHARTASPRLLPGAEALRVKYAGAKSPFVEEWNDLTAAYVKQVVRNGVQAMPFTRKTEISDAQLDDLAAYLLSQPGK